MKNILIIGVGGIGSYLCKELSRLIKIRQINLDEIDIYLADGDSVEIKNLKYQNFNSEDTLKNKAEVLGKRYCFNYIDEKIVNLTQLKDYDLIILAVDNYKARKLVYDYCYKNNKEFFDLRAEGRSIAVFSKNGQDKKELLKTLNTGGNNSCQLQYELKNNIIQNGNVVVASIGSQMILNYLRGENNNPKLIIRI